MAYGKSNAHSKSLVTSQMAHIFKVTFGKSPPIKSRDNFSTLWTCAVLVTCTGQEKSNRSVEYPFQVQASRDTECFFLQSPADTRWMNKLGLVSLENERPHAAEMSQPNRSHPRWANLQLTSTWLIQKLIDKADAQNGCTGFGIAQVLLNFQERWILHIALTQTTVLETVMLPDHHPQQLLILRKPPPPTFLFSKVLECRAIQLSPILATEFKSGFHSVYRKSHFCAPLVWFFYSESQVFSLTISSFKEKREAHTMYFISPSPWWDLWPLGLKEMHYP